MILKLLMLKLIIFNFWNKKKAKKLEQDKGKGKDNKIIALKNNNFNELIFKELGKYDKLFLGV